MSKLVNQSTYSFATGRKSAKAIAFLCCASLIAQQAIPMMAQNPQSAAPNAPAPQSAPVPPPSDAPANTTVTVPFNLFLKRSLNPLDPYRGKTVPPVNMANSPRLDSLVKDGEI